MQHYETLRLIRNILLRSFAVGVVITLLLALIIFYGWTIWVSLANEWLHIDAVIMAQMTLGFFLSIRFFLLFILLTPALAMHWTLKKEQNLKKS